MLTSSKRTPQIKHNPLQMFVQVKVFLCHKYKVVAPLPTKQVLQNQQIPINSTNVETQQQGLLSQNDFIEFFQIESHNI